MTQLGLDPQSAMEVWRWVTVLWPIVGTLLYLLAAKPRSQSPWAFVVLGVLTCFGVQSLVGLASIQLPAALASAASAPQRMLQFMLAHTVRSVGISVCLSFMALWWLHRSLGGNREVHEHAA